jgi:hypothetical protein
MDQFPTCCRAPVKALNKVVLPQLGLPTTAIVSKKISYPLSTISYPLSTISYPYQQLVTLYCSVLLRLNFRLLVP